MAGDVPDEIWLKWEKQGKPLFLKLIKKFVKNNQTENISQAVLEFLSKAALGTLKKESVNSVMGEVIPLHDDIPGIILDALYALDAETGEEDEEQRQNLYNVIKDLEKCLPESLLKERLELDTLLSVGTLKNKNFRTKFIRVKTKLYYKQKKFNLFREESEGYAKLITELNQEVSNSFTSANIWEATKSLIGCFNLDPNRVVDLILEALEIRPECSGVFIDLLKNFADVETVICEILGFKYVHFHRNKGDTPQSLYTLSALLLQREMLPLDDLYLWLMPLDSTIEKEWEIEMKRHRDAVKKLNSLSLNKDKDEPEPELDPPYERYIRNQKFGLCEALLRGGAWCLAKNIINRLPLRCVLNQPPVSKALCLLIHSTIEPLYARAGGIPPKVLRTPVPPVTSPLSPAAVSQFLDMRHDVIPMLTTLGAGLHIDPLLVYKIVRVSRAAMQELPGPDVKQPPSDDSLYFDILTLLDLVVLPSLSYLECNCGLAEEIWTLLRHFPYYHRYCLYSRWKNDSDNPQLQHKNAEVLKLLKNLMKRVSKENIKPIGRLLGKLTHACPGVLFDYVLIQLQTYENLIQPVVDSLKFLTSLSYDVLGFCIVETLAKASNDKSRHKFDGTTISNWLQALASFCGAAFKKYNIELTGLLQFVANQLKDKNSLDLLIVREVVVKMAGIEAAEEMTNEQLNAMSGGELLKGEAAYFSQVRNTKKSSLRLKEALNEQDLGPALCLLMAQQRNCVVYQDEETTHLKHVGRLYDQCQDTLVQFGTFLCASLSVDEYVSKFPSIHAMLSEYHIGGDVAFFLARPTLNHAINMKYEGLRKADSNKKWTQTVKNSKYCEAVQSVLTPLVDSVRSLHPAKVWEELSPQFMVTFWSLSMYDLQVPKEGYEKEIAKLKAIDGKDLGGSKARKEIERTAALREKLQEEQRKQTEHVEKVIARLRAEKSTWFLNKAQKSLKNVSIMQFLQLCIFPRSLFTANDAIFCAKFITLMQQLGTENFPTILCLDRLFCDITYSVTMCTENEANRYGRFLCAILGTLLRWHGDIEVFNKECLGTTGFEANFKCISTGGSKIGVTHEPYRDLCHKWYFKITRAMLVCLSSKDFNQIRNALIVLIKILPHFPLLIKLANAITKNIEKLRQEEKNNRPDLYILATSYYGQLRANIPSLIRESDFHVMQPKKDVKKDTTENKEEEKKVEKKESKEKTERRVEPKVKVEISPTRVRDRSKDRSDKEKDKGKETYRDRTRDRKDDKQERTKEERTSHRDERYIEKEDRYSGGREEIRYSSKEENRYSGGGYYSDNHFYEENRELSSVSNGSPRSLDNSDPLRDSKRRKVEASSSKGLHSPEWVEPVSSAADKGDKKERGSRSKEKAPRKERKTTRKRDRYSDDGSPTVESPKVRKEDDLSVKPQNGSSETLDSSHRSKKTYGYRDKTPVYERERERERERSRDDKSHIREKHRRSEPTKRR